MSTFPHLWQKWKAVNRKPYILTHTTYSLPLSQIRQDFMCYITGSNVGDLLETGTCLIYTRIRRWLKYSSLSSSLFLSTLKGFLEVLFTENKNKYTEVLASQSLPFKVNIFGRICFTRNIRVWISAITCVCKTFDSTAHSLFVETFTFMLYTSKGRTPDLSASESYEY